MYLFRFFSVRGNNMNKLNTAWNFIRDMFGFRRNSKYVRTYLNDANVKSSIYMSFVVILLEIWMIVRQCNQYVVPNWATPDKYGYSSGFALLFGMTSLYFLFIMCSVAMMVFAIFHYKKIENKGSFITNIVLGLLCIVWAFIVFAEVGVGNISFETGGDSRKIVSLVTNLLLYFSMPFLGASIIGNTLYKRIKGKNSTFLTILVIICFALICLLFGIKVGYSDYTSKSKPKMIICFLTMVVFVACLLIWKPYISIIMLAGIFTVFLVMLKGYNPDNMIDSRRIWQDGDEINYITFLVSLTMITISIYQQRITEAKKDEKLIHDAMFDHLADIHNVKYLADKITSQSLIDPNFYADKIYLFINIAHFRIYNDQKGFEAGDLFIIKMARFVKETFGSEFVARQSDDHFIVFTSATGVEEKVAKLKKLVDDASEGLFIRLKVGGYRPQPDDHHARSIDKARYACGMIKRKQEEYYSEYTDEMDTRLKRRQYIVNHLDEAIENGWIMAYYQPVVWSDSKEVCGAEALARWIDPTYGFLSPGDFIPVLEEARLIHKLDACIIEYVCKKMRKAFDEGRHIVPVSINFSRLDFELMDVIEVLETSRKKYNIDREYIHVEVTESALSADVDSLHKTIGKLKEMGYAIWLDDFGSGYSSLNVLKDFDFDVIKIDMTFLSNFHDNIKSRYVLDCIIQLAEKLEMKTLTEGVETEEEAEFLESIGCGRLQGYLFGKPFKLDDFEDKIYKKELPVSNKKI